MIRTLQQILDGLPEQQIRLIKPINSREIAEGAFGALLPSDPTPNDDVANTAGNGFFGERSWWQNSLTGSVWYCQTGNPPGAAVWVMIYPQASPTPPNSLLIKLAAFWTLNEAGGTRRDSLGNYDLTETGANPTPAIAGVIGLAANFTKSAHQQLTGPSAIPVASGEALTVAGWIKLDGSAGNEFFENGAFIFQSLGAFNLNDSGVGGYLFTYTGTDTNQYSATGVSSGTTDWVFFRAWFDPADGKTHFKLNEGALQSGSALTDPFFINSGDPAVSFGRSGHWGSFAANQWGVWNRLLTDDEGIFLYNAGQGRTYPFIPVQAVPANTFYAGPVSGSDALPDFRKQVLDDQLYFPARITAGPAVLPALAVFGVQCTWTMGDRFITAINPADVASLFATMEVVDPTFNLPSPLRVTSVNPTTGVIGISVPTISTESGGLPIDFYPYGWEWEELSENASSGGLFVRAGGRTGTYSTAPAFALNYPNPTQGMPGEVTLFYRGLAGGLPTYSFYFYPGQVTFGDPGQSAASAFTVEGNSTYPTTWNFGSEVFLNFSTPTSNITFVDPLPVSALPPGIPRYRKYVLTPAEYNPLTTVVLDTLAPNEVVGVIFYLLSVQWAFTISGTFGLFFGYQNGTGGSSSTNHFGGQNVEVGGTPQPVSTQIIGLDYLQNFNPTAPWDLTMTPTGGGDAIDGEYIIWVEVITLP